MNESDFNPDILYIMGDKKRIKIGVSKQPRARLSTIRTGNPEDMATWLMDVMQNPLHSQRPDQEDHESKEYRGDLFLALKNSLEPPMHFPPNVRSTSGSLHSEKPT